MLRARSERGGQRFLERKRKTISQEPGTGYKYRLSVVFNLLRYRSTLFPPSPPPVPAGWLAGWHPGVASLLVCSLACLLAYRNTPTTDRHAFTQNRLKKENHRHICYILTYLSYLLTPAQQNPNPTRPTHSQNWRGSHLNQNKNFNHSKLPDGGSSSSVGFRLGAWCGRLKQKGDGGLDDPVQRARGLPDICRYTYVSTKARVRIDCLLDGRQAHTLIAVDHINLRTSSRCRWCEPGTWRIVRRSPKASKRRRSSCSESAGQPLSPRKSITGHWVAAKKLTAWSSVRYTGADAASLRCVCGVGVGRDGGE